MPAPTFLCVGAQKCGTSWLSRALLQHPQIATGKQKELHFFDNTETYARGIAWYERQFRSAPGVLATGEFTPNYFLDSADRVADAYPDLQLILCLRDPVDRSVSAYFHNMNAGRYPPSVSLPQAIEMRPKIRDFGLYARQLESWLARFPRQAIEVLVYEEDISPDPAKPQTLRRACEHLGVDPDVELGELDVKRNAKASDFDLRRKHAGPLKKAVLDRVPERLRTSSMWDLSVSDRDREAMTDFYRPDTRRLEEMLGRSLPWSTSSAR